jgi:uncharacterized protein YutE (UPF0331/DUF86 family)
VVDEDVFDRRLERLEQAIVDLRSIAALDRARFVADRALQAQAERWTQVAVEACVDLAHHLIADRGWSTPSTYRDAFRILGEHSVIAADAVARMAGWAGLRNILVHLYLDVDHARLHEVLVSELDDLVEYAAALAAQLKPEPP